MIECPLFTVDAFTAVPFRGNPASVCILDRDLPAPTMQSIAAEMNHSETAFVRPLDGDAHEATRYALRWFTPMVEVPLCGHATLASAAVLFRELKNRAPEVAFETASGTLIARRGHTRIVLDFPARAMRPVEIGTPLLAALGVREIVAAFSVAGDRNLLLHLACEQQLRSLTPDFAAMKAACSGQPVQGIIVTARGAGEHDFISRYFAPWAGIDEDPVTGSAHCALAPYWAPLTGKDEMRAYQASPRGGHITVRARGDRVDLVGDAVVVTAGRLRLDEELVMHPAVRSSDEIQRARVSS